jgi:hypothetical protein
LKKILIPVLVVVALLAIALVAVPALADGWQPRCGQANGNANCQGRAGDTAACPRLNDTVADDYTCPRLNDTEATCPALQEGTSVTENQVPGCCR